MNTAKTLQLLDAQSNNISPATNIESIYYEVMDGGVIYRNSLYKHFPIYVKYNNNIDNPIIVRRGSDITDDEVLYFIRDRRNADEPIGDSSNFRLSQKSSGGVDIFLSSIRQSRLKNTRYYKLDISTYNFSDIMSLYAPKLWVQNNISRIDYNVDNIIYDSSIITAYQKNDQFGAYIRTNNDVGNIAKGTPGEQLNNKRINDLLDSILFSRTYPYIYDASIHMDKPESFGDMNIDALNLSSFDFNSQFTASYDISTSPGKIKIVYFNSSTMEADPDTTLSYTITHIDDNNLPASGLHKNVLFRDCQKYYDSFIDELFELFPEQTIDVDTRNTAAWQEFESNIINGVTSLTAKIYGDEYLQNINWKTDIIAHFYEDRITNYPRRKQNKKEKGRVKLREIFTETLMFQNEFFIMLSNDINIKSGSLDRTDSLPTRDYKTNFGEPLSTNEYLSHVYCGYHMPYNDFYYDNNTKQLTATIGEQETKVNVNIPLRHKFILRVPIIISDTERTEIKYVSGIKTQYIDYLQNTEKDTIIFIPKIIDNSLIKEQDKYIQLPELVAIGQNGVFMPANNWVIDKIYHEESFTDEEHSENNIDGDYKNTAYENLESLFNIYVIKSQKSYDNTIIGGKRIIRIKIETTYDISKIEN